MIHIFFSYLGLTKPSNARALDYLMGELKTNVFSLSLNVYFAALQYKK